MSVLSKQSIINVVAPAMGLALLVGFGRWSRSAAPTTFRLPPKPLSKPSKFLVILFIARGLMTKGWVGM